MFRHPQQPDSALARATAVAALRLDLPQATDVLARAARAQAWAAVPLAIAAPTCTAPCCFPGHQKNGKAETGTLPMISPLSTGRRNWIAPSPKASAALRFSDDSAPEACASRTVAHARVDESTATTRGPFPRSSSSLVGGSGDLVRPQRKATDVPSASRGRDARQPLIRLEQTPGRTPERRSLLLTSVS